MTSSERVLKDDAPRWDYGIQQYKSNRDVFCEPTLFSIIVVAHGRPDVTKETVRGTMENVALYEGEVEWIFIENAECEENYEYFQSLELERKVVVRQKNYGINEAINQGWALSRGEFVMILENDWESRTAADFLFVARRIFFEQPQVGMIQMRDPRDPHENHGLGKPLYNPWTCDPKQVHAQGVTMSRQELDNGHVYLLANHPNGFNNNPIIIRKQIYRECGFYPEPICGSDPRHGESEYQERVGKTSWLTAYIGIPLYWHLGRVQTRAT